MCENSEITLKERYEMLKSLCRQQIVINETLKIEVQKLNSVIKKVSHERSILLDELLKNHSDCNKALKDDAKPMKKSLNDNTDKRLSSMPIDQQVFEHKKQRYDGYLANELGSDYQNDQINSMRLSTDSNNMYMLDQDHSTSSTSPVSFNKGRFQNHASNMRGHVSQNVSNSSDMNSHIITGQDSPPPLTSSATASQRTSKLASLVTNSTLPSPIPFVSYPSQTCVLNNNNNNNNNQAKYVSVSNRPMKIVSSVGNAPAVSHVGSSGIIKSLPASSFSTSLRVSNNSATPSPRIMIQSSNVNAVRSILVSRTQANNLSDKSLEIGYNQR